MKEISVSELQQWRAENKAHQLIDVREEYEHENVNIQGELIPMGEIPNRLEEVRKDVPVVFHCKTGGRSGNVTKYMMQRGYDNVYNLKGGIYAWIDEIDSSLSKY
ncbi:MAG: rhodanese-like domain-containing protein [Bacteroidia bacterium]